MHFGFSYFKEAYVYVCLLLLLFSCSEIQKKEVVVKKEAQEEPLLVYFNEQLDSSILSLRRMERVKEKEEAWPHYRKAREHFKKAEALFAFIDKESYLALNQPNLLKVQEEDATDIKIGKPFGFQVLEEAMLEKVIDTAILKRQLEASINRLSFVRNNSNVPVKKYHILWVFRDQLVRVATLGLSGFDSPSANSLEESAYTYQGMIALSELYRDNFNDPQLYASWLKGLKEGKSLLAYDFDTFDRYHFIQKSTHPLLQLLQHIREDWQVDYPLELAFNNNVSSLFTDTTFNLDFFYDYHEGNEYTLAKVELGKKLFRDVRLAESKQMSCASCHLKEKAFTDGLVTFPKQKRNTPTLSYAAYQQAFFYDNRAGSLEGQIVGVIENENEFHSDLKKFTEVVLADSSYGQALKKSYGAKLGDLEIRNALASYVRSLTSFNSKFDENINGLREDLSDEERLGFNLFMGKAQCATCHFPPTFNGTVPPYFTTTEMELIGVPGDTIRWQIDDDPGRFMVFGTEERRHFFKTPTVRNASLTAPYMHNGVFETLKQVVEFYNNGGGVGHGMDLPYQTLPTDSLHLSKEEIKSLLAFMKSLEDQSVE
jgi:cytochrome c peroxidase